MVTIIVTETSFEVTATFAEDQTLIGRGISRAEAVGNLILEHSVSAWEFGSKHSRRRV